MSALVFDIGDGFGARSAPAQVRVSERFNPRVWAKGAPTISGQRRCGRAFRGPKAWEAAKAFVAAMQHEWPAQYPIVTSERGTIFVDLLHWPKWLDTPDAVYDALYAWCEVVE